MKNKWLLFCLLTAFYVLGVIGLSMHTYSTGVALQKVDPRFIPALETIKMIFVMMGGFGVFVATYFYAFNSLEASKTAEARLRFDIIEYTYSLIKEWDDPSLLAARRYSREIKAKHRELSANDLIKEIDSTPELKESIVLLINYFEQMRVSINTARVDNRVLADSMKPTFLDIFERFKPYISEKFPAKILNDLNDLKDKIEKA